MVEDLFIKLASIDSPSGNETEVASFVYGELLSCGVSCTTDNEGNILSKTNGKGEPFLISAHLDTVQGNTHIKPQKVGGIIISSGDTILGADNKAAVASIISALKKVKSVNRKNLEIIFSVREETDGGISNINLNWVKSKSGISADSGEPIGSIISETPYISGFEIAVVGKSSHSSESEFGINALSIASDAISGFKWGKIDSCSSANIGLIEGGSAVNTTPGEILLKGEIRSCNIENLENIKNDLEKVFDRSAKMFGGRIDIKHEHNCVGYSFEEDDLSFDHIKSVYKKLKIKETYKKSFGASDANFFNSMGIKVVDIGDGVRNPHTNQESIKINDLHRLTDIFTDFIQA